MDIEPKDRALESVKLLTEPLEKHAVSQRVFQGVPSIERTNKGCLWVAYYTGGQDEGPDNFVVLQKSDDGRTWLPPQLIVDPPGKVRAFDPCLWLDPSGRLWLFWSQSYGLYDGRCGVWCSVCSNPDQEEIKWSSPRRIGNGIMLNKPTVLASGEWLLPTCLWAHKKSYLNDLPAERYSNILSSSDQGETFAIKGRADVPNRHCDEHMVVERQDGSLWMLVRTTYGIGESISHDQGKTWSPGRPTRIGGPNSRFFIRRLRSGRLLLVNHFGFSGRSHLTAQLSEDDGLTWSDGLLLDERKNVSYPDGVETADGIIYIVYDRERYRDMEVLMAVFTEADIQAGRCVTDVARLKVIVSKVGTVRNSGRTAQGIELVRQRYLVTDWKMKQLANQTQRSGGKEAVYLTIQYIEDQLVRIRNMRDVADAMGYSLPHLTRLFSQELGMSLQAYYTKRKWRKAMELLEEGSESITDVASKMGYESIHTFSRAFRIATGLSPSDYIRKFRETCRILFEEENE